MSCAKPCVKKTESLNQLSELKQQYMQQTTAPLDGMWLSGFVPMATHFEFRIDDKLAGFYCINDENFLLQFFVAAPFQSQSAQLFELPRQANNLPHAEIKGAFVSTAEPQYLSLCLDQYSQFDVHTFMYQHDRVSNRSTAESAQALTVMNSDQLTEAVDFAVASIGAPAEWLNGYYANLINRKELYGVWKNDCLIATGESRKSDDYQPGYADVGMIVAESERGHGLATQILGQLTALNEEQGLKSICSTERSNVAAQKAICRAGFHASHRILQFHSSQT